MPRKAAPPDAPVTVPLRPGQTVLVKADKLWRGPGFEPECGSVLRVESGILAAVHRTGHGHSPGPAETIDLPGRTVMPGFVDCHVHLGLDPSRRCGGQPAQTDWRKRLLCLAAKGVMAARDAGDSLGIGLVASSSSKGPPLVIPSGRPLRKRGMYGSFLGPALGGESLEEAVRRLRDMGARVIKVLATGPASFSEYGRVGGIQFSREELGRICAEAHALGLRVMVHANSHAAVVDAVLAGADSIEHGYFMKAETIELLASRQVGWVPTVVPVAVHLGDPLRNMHDPTELGVIERTYEAQLEAIWRARLAGVLLGVGTDAGAPGVFHGKSYSEELSIYREAGLAVADVLKAATEGGARILGLEESTGKLEPGRPANMIAVVGDPWADFGALARVTHVFSARFLE